MKSLTFSRLESRLLTTLGTGLIVFSVIAGCFTYLHAYRNELDLARSLQQQLVGTVQIQAEVAAFAANTQIANGVLTGLLANPVILAARIDSTEGFAAEMDYRQKSTFGLRRTYELHSPVDGKEPIGKLTVVQNDERVQSSAVRTALFQTAIMLLQVLTAVLIMAAVLRNRMIRPITRLANAMADIEPGGSARLTLEPEHAVDEIGLLTNRANALLGASENAIVQLKQQNGLLTSLLKSLPMGVFMVEAPSGKPLMANDSAFGLLGRGLLPDAARHNLGELYQVFKLGSGDPYPPEEMPIMLGMSGISAHVDDMVVERPDGTKSVLEVFGTPVTDEHGKVRASLVSFMDISERKQMEERVRQLAFHDTLTGLPNRRLLSDRLRQAMVASKRSACHGALLFLDLDNFKPLNDAHGHSVGDLLLIEAAQRMRRCVREMDTVARFGGDEFVVLISVLDISQAESGRQALNVAEKIRKALSAPYCLTVVQTAQTSVTIVHQCTTSIGIQLFGHQEVSQDDILKWADAAMYQAKNAGRNQIRFHDAPA